MDKWVLLEDLLDPEEEESETNPKGFWLGNKESNMVFILPEDLDTVTKLLNQ